MCVEQRFNRLPPRKRNIVIRGNTVDRDTPEDVRKRTRYCGAFSFGKTHGSCISDCSVDDDKEHPWTLFGHHEVPLEMSRTLCHGTFINMCPPLFRCIRAVSLTTALSSVPSPEETPLQPSAFGKLVDCLCACTRYPFSYADIRLSVRETNGCLVSLP